MYLWCQTTNKFLGPNSADRVDRNESAAAILDIPERLDLDVPLVGDLQDLHGAELLPQGTLRLYTREALILRDGNDRPKGVPQIAVGQARVSPERLVLAENEIRS